jgi:hypothetical protein
VRAVARLDRAAGHSAHASLAGRINNIVYTPLLNVRDAYSDQPNYVNGGNTVNGGVWPQPIG